VVLDVDSNAPVFCSGSAFWLWVGVVFLFFVFFWIAMVFAVRAVDSRIVFLQSKEVCF
jgi:hypothetical protein